jgi:hypothetical protein
MQPSETLRKKFYVSPLSIVLGVVKLRESPPLFEKKNYNKRRNIKNLYFNQNPFPSPFYLDSVWVKVQLKFL